MFRKKHFARSILHTQSMMSFSKRSSDEASKGSGPGSRRGSTIMSTRSLSFGKEAINGEHIAAQAQPVGGCSCVSADACSVCIFTCALYKYMPQVQHAVIDIDSGTTARSPTPETSGSAIPAAASAGAGVAVATPPKRSIRGGPSFSHGTVTPFQTDGPSSSPHGHSPGARGRNVHWEDEGPFGHAAAAAEDIDPFGQASAAARDEHADSPFEASLHRKGTGDHEPGDSPFESALQDGSPFESVLGNGHHHDGAVLVLGCFLCGVSHARRADPPALPSVQLASENNITGTCWRYGLPPPDLQEYLESVKAAEEGSGDLESKTKTSADSQDSPSGGTPSKHRFRGALAAVGGALGGMVGAATAAVRHMPRPASPRGQHAEELQDVHVVDIAEEEEGERAVGTQSSGAISVGRYVLLMDNIDSLEMHVLAMSHYSHYSYLATPTTRSISLRSIALAPGSSTADSVEQLDIGPPHTSARLDPVLELDGASRGGSRSSALSAPSASLAPSPLLVPPPMGDSSSSSRRHSRVDHQLDSSQDSMRPLESANSNFAALVGRVERERSLAHSSGSGGMQGIRGLVEQTNAIGGRRSEASGGGSGPSWTSSDASSFTVGLDRLAEKLRSRPSGSSVPSGDEARRKLRARSRKKLRRSNSLPMPETEVLPGIVSSGDSDGA